MGGGRGGDGRGGLLLLLLVSWGASWTAGDLIGEGLEDEPVTADKDDGAERDFFVFRGSGLIEELPAPFCFGGPMRGTLVRTRCGLGERSSFPSSGLGLLALNVCPD